MDSWKQRLTHIAITALLTALDDIVEVEFWSEVGQHRRNARYLRRIKFLEHIDASGKEKKMNGHSSYLTNLLVNLRVSGS